MEDSAFYFSLSLKKATKMFRRHHPVQRVVEMQTRQEGAFWPGLLEFLCMLGPW